MDETLRKDFSGMRPEVGEAERGSAPGVRPEVGGNTDDKGTAGESSDAAADNDSPASRNEAP